MKIILLLTISLITLPFAAFAIGTKDGGGGGNSLHTPIEKVSFYTFGHYPYGNALDKLNRVLSITSKGLSELPEGVFNAPIMNPKAKKIFSKILTLKGIIKYSFFDNIMEFSSEVETIFEKNQNLIKFEKDKPCIDSGEEKDASVKFHKNENDLIEIEEVCLSSLRLSLFQETDLVNQITSLFIHELAHVAGFSEDDADFIQKYTYDNLLDPCIIWIDIKNVEQGKNLAQLNRFNITIERLDFNRITVMHNISNNVSVKEGEEGYAEQFVSLSQKNRGKFSFQLNLTKERGYVKFKSANFDGTTQSNFVEWGILKENFTGHSYYSDIILNHDINTQNQKLIPTNVWITPNCIL